MKCLSSKHPYAELLVSGKKTIELRKWNTNFRGIFLIHTSRNIDKEKCKSLGIDYTKLSTGMIIGKAILYDVKKYDNKDQFLKDKNRHHADANLFETCIYGFKIKNAQRLRHPISFSGKLRFFKVDRSIIDINK
jgi:hypothetical protein